MPPPRFKTALEVKDLALPPLHDVLEAYAMVDVRRGTFEVFIEAEAEGVTTDHIIAQILKDVPRDAAAALAA